MDLIALTIKLVHDMLEVGLVVVEVGNDCSERTDKVGPDDTSNDHVYGRHDVLNVSQRDNVAITASIGKLLDV